MRENYQENMGIHIESPALAGLCVHGGDACESNTPETFCAPHNGFEGRGAHQGSSISAAIVPSRASLLQH